MQERTTWRAQGLAAEVCTQDSSRRSSSRGAVLRRASGWAAGRARWSGSSKSSKRRSPAVEALADPLELEEQREVELARPQARRDLLRLALGERDLDARVGGAEGGDRLRHQRRAGGREGGRAQVAAAARGDRRDLVFGGLELGEDAVDVRGQRGAGGGGADAAAAALDQRRPGFGLERRDRLRDRRLRVASASAAAEKEPCATTSRKMFSRFTLSISAAYSN